MYHILFRRKSIDAKNAIRFLREHASDYHIDSENIILMGDSSGGHTALLAGMTAVTGQLDEPINARSAAVKGIIDIYGVVEVTLENGFPHSAHLPKEERPENRLIGFAIEDNREAAKVANVTTYLDGNYPPILILHGTKDRKVVCQHSVILYQALQAKNHPVEAYLIEKSDHGGAAFWTDEALAIYDRFVQNCIK